MLERFKEYLVSENKSKSTIENYIRYIKKYYTWYNGTFASEPTKLYRQNIVEFRSYLIANSGLNNKTINSIITALIKYNEYLIDAKIQHDMVVSKKDMTKVQMQYANPTDTTKADIEAFRQLILEKEGNRNYAIVTTMAYAGLRISECLELTFNDVDFAGHKIRVSDGKGNKQRFIPMSDKIVTAIKEYLKGRKEDATDYIFVSNKGGKIDRTVINKIFNKYSDKITPHSLRHFFCTLALENGFNVHEVANMAGHSNIHTTLIYTNPSEKEMLNKINRL